MIVPMWSDFRIPGCYEGEETIKLFLLFIMIDLLSLMAYPVVFMFNKLHQFSKFAESKTRANSSVIGTVALDEQPILLQ